MKVVFYARPWSIDLFMAIEDQWRARGEELDVLYIANHLKACRRARERGRRTVFLPAAIAELAVTDPISVLAEMESRYGSGLFPFYRYLMAERMFVGKSPPWQIDQIARYALYFHRLFETERPGGLIGEAADIMPNWLAYDMARQRECEPVGLMPSGIPPNRLVMCRAHNEVAHSRENYREFQKGGLTPQQLERARTIQDIVLGTGTKLSYLPPQRSAITLLRRIVTGIAVKRQLQFALEQAEERRAGNWFVEPNPVLRWLGQPFRRARAAVADRLFLNGGPPERPFVFFPLHFEPEAVLLIQSSYFGNQLEVIRNLARSLPIGWELVVKEHFGMRGQRRLDFYRRLNEIPGVRLAPFELPTNQLIRQAEVVAVISGTAGLEASLIGQPVVTFGETVWDFAPTIHKVGALPDLPELLRSAAASRLSPGHPDVLAFAAAWDAALPPGRYYNNAGFNWLNPQNVEEIARAIWQRISADAAPGDSLQSLPPVGGRAGSR
jgi:hypothetical protein